MPLFELLGGTHKPPVAGPRIRYRQYTRSGHNALRFKYIPFTRHNDELIAFIVVEHEHAPAKMLPEVNMLGSYVLDWDNRIIEHKNRYPESWTWTPISSSDTSPQDREPPMRAEPVPPGPGLPTRSSRRKSSAPSVETTTEAQLRLDL